MILDSRHTNIIIFCEKEKTTVKARSHCTICENNLFLLVMGCIGAGDVELNPIQSICCDERNRSRNQKKTHGVNEP